MNQSNNDNDKNDNDIYTEINKKKKGKRTIETVPVIVNTSSK